jgi:hypothetical protein
MTTIKSIQKQIDQTNKDINNLKVELSFYRYKKSEEDVKIKNELNKQIQEKEIEIGELKTKLNQHEEIRRKIVWGSIYCTCAVLFIAGLIFNTIYRYKLGLEIYTETHNITGAFSGNVSLISTEIYNNLFLLKSLGVGGIVTGLLGGLVTFFVHTFNIIDY